jgi:hypothetical protein
MIYEKESLQADLSAVQMPHATIAANILNVDVSTVRHICFDLTQ